MKKLFPLLIVLTFFILQNTNAQNAGINNDGSQPHTSAMLDIKSPSKGVLIPRVALTGTGDVTTVVSPAVSLLVYNTATAGTGGSAVDPGFYFWNGSNWSKLNGGSTSSWSLSGNAGINPAINFIGTTDSSALQFRVNNQPAGKIDIHNANSFWGYASGQAVTTGVNNASFGNGSMRSNTTGRENTAIGKDALFTNTEGSNNTAIGFQALPQNNTGFENTAIGRSALFNTSTGIRNTAVGRNALWTNSTGSLNTGLGYGTIVFPGDLTNATAIGALATVGCSNCLVLGSVNGVNGATSNVNVGIGTGTPAQALSFAALTGGKISFYESGAARYGIGIQSSLLQLYTGFEQADIAFGWGTSENFNEAVRIKGNKRIGIGTSDPQAPLDVRRTGNATADFHGTETISHFNLGVLEDTYIRGGKSGAHVLINDYNGAGNVGIGTSAPGSNFKLDVNGFIRCQLLLETSDARLKKEIQPLSPVLAKIKDLNAYTYRWSDIAKDQTLQLGLLAQEVKAVFPELVREDDKGMMAVRYSGMIPVLLEAIKEQQKQIDELKRLVILK